MTSHAVVIAGGGPTGLMLAAELALAGVDVAVVERRMNQEVDGSRAGGLHARTIEVLDQRGVAERFISEGQKHPGVSYASTPLATSDLPSRHNYTLALWQRHIERILAGWVAELAVTFYRGRDVTGFGQDAGGVDARLSDGTTVRAAYLVGCDGGRSVIRKAAGIDFVGTDPSISCMLAEVELAAEPPFWGIRNDASGIYAFGKLPEGPARVMLTEKELGATAEPTLQDLRAALTARYGSDFGVHSPRWIGRFSDMARQAASYRAGRVLLAGDAAHVHSPVGGQGLGTGVQDAVNLGWKLAAVVNGTAPQTLLDTYHRERHPVGARVLRHTRAQVVFHRETDQLNALKESIAEMLAMEEPRKRYAAMMTGLDIHYDLGEGHPLLGRRMPDLDIVGPDGPMRVYSLLHAARPVLLDLGDKALDITGWQDRVRVVRASYAGPWELPVLGVVSSPSAVLIRPDGHVAWVGQGTDAMLVDALATWFGPSRM